MKGDVHKNAPRTGELVLDERLPLRAGLGAAFAGVIGYARAMADHASVDPVRAVHEYRKAVRRARAVLRLSRPVLRRSNYEAMLGELRRAIGTTSPLRDAEVLLEALSGVPRVRGTGEARARAVKAIEALRERSAVSGRAQTELRQSAWIIARLPERLFRALPAHLGWREIEQGLRRSYRRAKKARREALDTRAPEAVHAFRKRVKELRYQLELLEAAAGRRLRQERRALGALAQRLGEATNLLALYGFLTSRRELSSLSETRLLAAVDASFAAHIERLVRARSNPFERRACKLAERALQRLELV